MDQRTVTRSTRRGSFAAAWPWPLLLILLLALGLRLALWSQPLHQPANDEVEYVTVAYDLLEGRGWEFYTRYHWLRAPLYPLFLAGSLWLARGNLYLAALPNILLSVATVYLIYRLTRELVDPSGRGSDGATRVQRGAPLLAALLAALLFTFNTFASLYMSETLFSFLLTAALLVLVRWKHRQSSPEQAAPGPAFAALAGAGVLFGLATLTRSVTLAFVPLVLLWILLPLRRRHAADAPPPQAGAVAPRRIFAQLKRIQPGRRSLAGALLFALCVGFSLAPWTIRNCRAYTSCILVETGLSYNLWAFNEPREDQATIFRTLEQIPDPAERASEATRRGLQRLQEDPALLLRKLWPNWVHLWRVKIIQDRFLLADYASDPPPLVFLGSLLLDDVLYLAILLAGVAGMSRALAGRQPAALLLAAWLAYIVGTTMLTHGESRYRHFIFPVLIPYAAIQIAGMTQWLAVRRRGGREGAEDASLHRPATLPGERGRVNVHAARRGRLSWAWRAGRWSLLLLLLYTFVISYPWNWATEGGMRSLHRLAGDVARAQGRLDAAAGAYRRALAVDETPDGWIALGDVRRRQGDLQAAEADYRTAWRQEIDYIPASARLGDLLRAQGRSEEARSAFVGRYVAEQAVLDWSWAHLTPPPAARLEIGEGLDFGYVSGLYPAEQQQGSLARWTDGHAQFRLAAPAGPAQAADDTPASVLQIRLAAPHPGRAQVVAHVCAGEQCHPVELVNTWRMVSIRLPAGSPTVVELHSPTFTAPDGRELGVLVDWIALETI